MSQLRVAGVVEDSIVDGPGLRLTVFTQGCPHGCLGCHNPQTWDLAGGTVREVADLAALLQRNPLLSGLTLSGGEPTLQAGACADLAAAARSRGLSVWCYTGYTYAHLLRRCSRDPDLERLLGLLDVLIDGPFVLAKRDLTLAWRGSSNQRLIDAPASHTAGCAVEWNPPNVEWPDRH